MRRILTILAMLMLACCLALAVSAAEGNSQRIQVTAKCETESYAPASYSVDISWTDMNFTYTRSQTHTWNPKNHSYKTATRNKWTDKEASITVTNHSNVDVRVKITFEPVEGTGITGVLKNASKKLKAGETGNYGGADSMTATLTVRGTPSELIGSEDTKIGEIVVTIQ